jgi:hypothetical protein
MWMAAALLIAVSPDLAVADPVVICADPVGISADAVMIESWTADQVRCWAVNHSPTANMLDAERRALGRGCDTGDSKQAAQVGLAQAVLGESALEERNKSAGEALTAYYQIIGLQSQLGLLREAGEELSTLLKFAQRAEEIALPAGDPNKLRRRQLEIQDRQIQAEYGLLKLRQHLAQLTGQSEAITVAAVLSDPLDLELIEMEREAAIAEAAANRGVLRAVRTLCRCMTEDSLPAARSLLGVLQPGLGLSFSGGALCFLKKLRLLCKLARQQESDLCWRRHQCRQLEAETYSIIRELVLHARLDLEQALARRELGDATARLALDAFNERTKAVELGQADVGRDRLDKLISLEADGIAIQRLVDIAVAEVAFRQAVGILAK